MSIRTLHDALQALGLSIRSLAKACGLTPGTAARLAKEGTWPTRLDHLVLGDRISAHLAAHGLTRAQLAELRASGALPMDSGVCRSLLLAAEDDGAPSIEQIEQLAAAVLAPDSQASPSVQPGEALSLAATPEALVQSPEENMLLECTPLTEQARKAWNLARSPFVDDVSSRDDVFASPATRRVRAALLDCAMHHGFIALIGESGSGKTTLREDLEQRIQDEDRPVVVIKPYTLAMEPNDAKGKQMKSGQIAESIAYALAPSMTLKRSPEARFRQVHELLRDSARAGHRHLLLIEEAHRMPLATLKHLKGWMELKDGLRRLLGVCLIGQPELAARLSETNAEIREIVQRCEKIFMEPLEDDLQGYLALKFARAGADAAEVFADDAYDALRAKLVQVPRGGSARDAYSICYPLAVNNHVARAMNAAARAGWPKVDAQVVAGS